MEGLHHHHQKQGEAVEMGTSVGKKGDLIIIHVCDEPRQINRDFACDRSILLREMKYFQGYLGGDQSRGGSTTTEDIDISVHCDLHIFEWLVQWIHSPERPPPLDASSVVSILISSEFLEMERLVEHCVEYIAGHLGEILRMPIDLGCISEKLVHRLAEKCDADALSKLQDRKDKLLPKLYKRRLEIDFRHRHCEAGASLNQRRRGGPRRLASVHAGSTGDDPGGEQEQDQDETRPAHSRVLRCRYCDKLYPEWAQRVLSCASAPTAVDVRGGLSRRHAPRTERWSLTEHVAALHATHNMSWAHIYWLMWGVTHVFRCRTCDAWFAADRADGCAYHENEPAINSGGGLDDDRYPCCGQPQRRKFSALGHVTGCKTRHHDVDQHAGSATPAALKLLARQAEVIVAAARARDAARNSDNDKKLPSNEKIPSGGATTQGASDTKNGAAASGTTTKRRGSSASAASEKRRGSRDQAETGDAPNDPGDNTNNGSDNTPKDGLDQSSSKSAAQAENAADKGKPPKPPRSGSEQRGKTAAKDKRGGAATRRATTGRVGGSAKKSDENKDDAAAANNPIPGKPVRRTRRSAGSSRSLPTSQQQPAETPRPASANSAPAATHYAVFEMAVADGDVLPRPALDSAILRESSRDADDRRQALVGLTPRQRRAWELDSAWLESDVSRMNQLAATLRAKRTPWPDTHPTRAQARASAGDAADCDGRRPNRDSNARRWR